MSSGTGCPTCAHARAICVVSSTHWTSNSPTATPTSSSPMTWKASSPNSAATPTTLRCPSANVSCVCSSRTSSSAQTRSPSGTASPSGSAPATATDPTTPTTQRVTCTPVIYCVGGVISPLLLNIVLHGMEQAAGVRYRKRSAGRAETAYDCPTLVRYADDLLAFCHSRQQAEQVKQRLAEWLQPRGLVFNQDKTRIVHVNQGCDFLGFNIRRYHGQLPLIKPSKEAVRRIRLRLRTEMRALRGGNGASVLRTLTPIIRGWAAYYRTQVSSEVFSALDDYMWKLLYKWAKHSHPNKSRWWRMDRYFDRFNPSRNDRWVFGDHDSGAYLPKFAWTKIVRHPMVAGWASPDDPTRTQYWADRRRRQPNGPLNVLLLARLKAQRGRCALCGTLLLHTGACQPF